MKEDTSGAIGEEIDMYPSAAMLRAKVVLWQHIMALGVVRASAGTNAAVP